jgi:hypothetical protein
VIGQQRESTSSLPRGDVLLRHAAFRRAVLEWDSQHRKLKTPPENRWGFYSGDVLLSHGLSPYYHRGCSVSLPCSEWERVVPLRYCHQSREALALLGSGGALCRATLVGAVH